MSSLEWRDRAYERTLEQVLAGLESRRRVDPSFSVCDAEGVLRDLYAQEGNDSGYQGMLQDAIIEATIAAHEEFIEAWKAEPPDAGANERSCT